MSYVEIKDFGGKDRGLKFNQVSLEIFSKSLKVDTPAASAIYATFYAGLMGFCYVKQEEPDFTFEQVTDWVDDLYEKDRKKEIEKVCDAWAATAHYRNWLSEFQNKIRAVLNPDEKGTKKKAK